MKNKIFKIWLLSILINGLFNQLVLAQDGAALYKPCKDCHTIGEGPGVGPDLKGITKRRKNDWLVRFIQSSAKVINSGDADANALYKQFDNTEMPDNALTVDQVNQILTYIEGGKIESAAVDPIEAARKKRADSLLKANSSKDILVGKELFNGEVGFENGGAPCSSCHNATFYNFGKGGLFAKDLTKAHSRLHGEAKIKGLIVSAPFPSMLETYKNNPVTDDEITYLQLFLKNTDAQNPIQPVVKQIWFLQWGIALSLLITLVISIVWYKRKRLSVNHSILKRQERYSK